MQNIFDTHDYDEHFLEQFISQTIPIYDLWSVRPTENEQKVLAQGASEETDKFSNFMNDHAIKEYPHPIVIVVGNAERNNPNKMHTSTMRYFKMKFDKFKGNDIGTPLVLNGLNQQQENGMSPLNMMGMGQRPGTNSGGISYNEIQGIIDRNVSDATRSIRSEYEEVNAKREVDAIKRIAELEAKMEMYKLEMRENEIDKKERKLQEAKEAFDNEKANGMGTLKDYTKTIAGGLIELGKSALGIDDKSSDQKVDKTTPKDDKDLKGTNVQNATIIEDDGFSETEPEDDNPFQDLIHVIENLSDDQKYTLLDVLVPGEKTEEIIQQPETTEDVDTSSNEDEKDNNIETS